MDSGDGKESRGGNDDDGGGDRGGGGGIGGGQDVSASGGERTSPIGAAGLGGGSGTYGQEEVTALKGIFNLYDAENTGTIGINELEGILQKVGHNPGEKTS